MTVAASSSAAQPRWPLFWTSLPVAVALTAVKLALDGLLGRGSREGRKA